MFGHMRAQPSPCRIPPQNERESYSSTELYSYSPGTNAFQAMALGRVAATGAQPEYYEYIGEPDTGAIIPLSPLVSDLEWKERFRSLHPRSLRSPRHGSRRAPHRGKAQRRHHRH